TIRVSTPSSIEASTVRRSARVPARWPAAMGSPRRRAQRAFPSRMIATDRASSGSSGSRMLLSPRSVLMRLRRFTRPTICSSQAYDRRRRALPAGATPRETRVLKEGARGGNPVSPALSDLENLGFLALERLVDLVDVLVRQLLDALLRPVLLVRAHLA